MMIVLVCDPLFYKQGYIYEVAALMLPFLQPGEGLQVLKNGTIVKWK